MGVDDQVNVAGRHAMLVESVSDRAADHPVISQHLLGTADAGIDQDSATGVGDEISVYRHFLEHCCQVQPRHLQGHSSSPITSREPSASVRTGRDGRLTECQPGQASRSGWPGRGR
jgi:hypothetical protein